MANFRIIFKLFQKIIKKLEVDLKPFLNSVDRVASVSLDKKDGVKFDLTKDNLDLSVNNTNSGDGKESLNVKFDHELEISFNSKYLIDVASQLDGEKIEMFFNDTGSPVLIKDPGDFDSKFCSNANERLIQQIKFRIYFFFKTFNKFFFT